MFDLQELVDPRQTIRVTSPRLGVVATVMSRVYADCSTANLPDLWQGYPQALNPLLHTLSRGQNRFAAFVVGDSRDKTTGVYVNFVSDTIAAFQAAGLHLYNNAILITMVGNLPIRAGAFMRKSRKLGKTHQDVLCFWKGDPSTVQEVIRAEFL
jgi:hypothetical protein